MMLRIDECFEQFKQEKIYVQNITALSVTWDRQCYKEFRKRSQGDD